jgi:hypothetical protein
VNYNVKHFLEQCLCFVQKAIAGLQAEVFVIDNNSAEFKLLWKIYRKLGDDEIGLNSQTHIFVTLNIKDRTIHGEYH